MMTWHLSFAAASVLMVTATWSPSSAPAGQQATSELDMQIQTFLQAQKGKWDYLNVPYEDGQLLHDLVIERGAKRILEVGTSTGHSTIWLAWAAAKTGGKVTTLEIDRGRHERALAHFKEAGVAQYIDARLGDAHALVKELPGPWDVVFQDADKEWYPQYFLDLDAKVSPGGCYTAHNVKSHEDEEGIRKFLALVEKSPDYVTTHPTKASGSGLSVSCKKKG